MKAMKKSAMETMKAMKAMKKHAKPMKTMKAMKKSATATGHAKLMQAKALKASAYRMHKKSLRMIKEHNKAMHDKSLRMVKDYEKAVNDKSLQLMGQEKAVTYQSTRFTEIVMNTEIIEIAYETNWGTMWWSLPADDSAFLMRQFRKIENGPKVVRFDTECAPSLHRTQEHCRHLHELSPDGEPTFAAYKWDFDNFKQRNMSTQFERNFRIKRMNAMMYAAPVVHSLCEIYTYIHAYTKKMYMSPISYTFHKEIYS